MGIGIAITISFMFLILQENGALVPDIIVWLWILLAMIPAVLIGMIIGTVIIWQMLLARSAAKIQGWPFKVDEDVVILKGRHKNKIAKIYEIWEGRGQVRLDLGEELKRDVKDVFCAVAVCRNQTPNQAVEGTAHPERFAAPHR